MTDKLTVEEVLDQWMADSRAQLVAWVNSVGNPFSDPPAPFPQLSGFQEVFAFVLEVLSAEIEANLKRVGFWNDGRTFGDEMALLHSEVSEALDAYRKHGLGSWIGEDGKPEGVGSEFADVFIRLLDDCARREFSLAELYRRKMEFNWTRPYRHGGQAL